LAFGELVIIAVIFGVPLLIGVLVVWLVVPRIEQGGRAFGVLCRVKVRAALSMDQR